MLSSPDNIHSISSSSRCKNNSRIPRLTSLQFWQQPQQYTRVRHSPLQHQLRRPAAAHNPSPSYNRQQSEQLYSSNPCSVITRGIQVVLMIAKLSLLHVQHSQPPAAHAAAAAAPSSPSGGTRASGQAGYATDVCKLLSELGVLWVKLGQTLSVRPDLVGPRLAAALAGLQEGAPPFDDAEAACIIQQDLGQPPSELFAWMSARPVASASLGQVYQAALASDGTVVAVKVQRPKMWEQLQLDLVILLSLLKLLKWAARIKQDITLWADTLGSGLAQELDYVQEAQNLELFASAHRHLGFVTTPTVVWQLTSQRVLTMTWMEGNTPGQILRKAKTTASSGNASNTINPPHQQLQHSPAAQQQLLQLVAMGVEASLCQLVTTGVLHADPHPGNLLLTPQGQLAYLDFGLLVAVPQAAQLWTHPLACVPRLADEAQFGPETQGMMSALMHWALANWLALAHDLGSMGLLKETTDRRELAADLEQQFTNLYTASAGAPDGRETAAAAAAAGWQESACAAPFGSRVAHGLLSKAGAISFGDFASVIAALALKHRFELPPYYTLMVRSLTTLEGFALLVDAGARYEIARAAVQAIARQLLSDSRPEAQQLLDEVLQDPRQPGCINLSLLQELLVLHQQQFPTHSAAYLQRFSGATEQTLETGAGIAAVTEGPVLYRNSVGASMQPMRRLKGAQAQQLWPALQLLQRFDARHVAQQLSSREAAEVRHAAAQWAASAVSRHGQLHWQQADLQQRQYAAQVWLQSACGATGGTDKHTNQLNRHQTRLSSPAACHRKQPELILALVWLCHAGLRGMLLVGQLLSLIIVLLVRRLLSWLAGMLKARSAVEL